MDSVKSEPSAGERGNEFNASTAVEDRGIAPQVPGTQKLPMTVAFCFPPAAAYMVLTAHGTLKERKGDFARLGAVVVGSLLLWWLFFRIWLLACAGVLVRSAFAKVGNRRGFRWHTILLTGSVLLGLLRFSQWPWTLAMGCLAASCLWYTEYKTRKGLRLAAILAVCGILLLGYVTLFRTSYKRQLSEIPTELLGVWQHAGEGPRESFLEVSSEKTATMHLDNIGADTNVGFNIVTLEQTGRASYSAGLRGMHEADSQPPILCKITQVGQALQWIFPEAQGWFEKTLNPKQEIKKTMRDTVSDSTLQKSFVGKQKKEIEKTFGAPDERNGQESWEIWVYNTAHPRQPKLVFAFKGDLVTAASRSMPQNLIEYGKELQREQGLR